VWYLRCNLAYTGIDLQTSETGAGMSRDEIRLTTLASCAG
jgi:hypothetical protein